MNNELKPTQRSAVWQSIRIDTTQEAVRDKEQAAGAPRISNHLANKTHVGLHRQMTGPIRFDVNDDDLVTQKGLSTSLTSIS